jgi:hypothetical protein
LFPFFNGKSRNGWKFAFLEILGAQSANGARYRLTVSGETEILYDHQSDPWEMKNAVGKLPDVTARMRQAIRLWLLKSGPIYPPRTF